MRTKFLVALFAVFCLWSCQDWGEMDPPAGNQQKPTLKELASYTFDDLGSDVSIGVYQGGKAPKLVVDKQLEVVLELDGGYVSYSNPLQFYTLQEAASLTGWVKLNESDEDTPIFCFSDETGSKKLMFTANSDLYYNEEKLNTNSLLLTAGEWHWFSVAVKPDSYAIYIDGVAVDGTITNDESVATVSRAVASGEVMNFMTEASKLYFGYGSKEKPVKMWIDEVSVYKNLITDKEIAKPELPEIGEGGDSGDGDNPGNENIYVLGAPDCSTGWWSEFSPIMKADGDCIFHHRFVNHTNGLNAWNNWVLGISNGKLPNEEGYQEYAIVRADNWGWLNGNGDNTIDKSGYPLSNTYDLTNGWTLFCQEMEGAVVDLTVQRKGSTLTMNADIVTKSKLNWTYSWTYGAIPNGELGVFLTVDGSYLEIDLEEAYVGNTYSQGYNVVGSQDNSTGWWGAHSSKVLMEGDGKVVYQLYNHTSKTNIWNSYVFILTTGTHPTESGYNGATDELLILRADPYGWGAIYDEGAITVIDGMDVEKADGALVTVSFTRKGTEVAYSASFDYNGTIITPYTYIASNFPDNQEKWAVFFTVDNCWLDIISVVTYPFIANIK